MPVLAQRRGLRDGVLPRYGKRQPVRLPFRLVDYTGKFSNLLEDLREIEKYANRVESASYSDIK